MVNITLKKPKLLKGNGIVAGLLLVGVLNNFITLPDSLTDEEKRIRESFSRSSLSFIERDPFDAFGEMRSYNVTLSDEVGTGTRMAYTQFRRLLDMIRGKEVSINLNPRNNYLSYYSILNNAELFDIASRVGRQYKALQSEAVSSEQIFINLVNIMEAHVLWAVADHYDIDILRLAQYLDYFVKQHEAIHAQIALKDLHADLSDGEYHYNIQHTSSIFHEYLADSHGLKRTMYQIALRDPEVYLQYAKAITDMTAIFRLNIRQSDFERKPERQDPHLGGTAAVISQLTYNELFVTDAASAKYHFHPNKLQEDLSSEHSGWSYKQDLDSYQPDNAPNRTVREFLEGVDLADQAITYHFETKMNYLKPAILSNLDKLSMCRKLKGEMENKIDEALACRYDEDRPQLSRVKAP